MALNRNTTRFCARLLIQNDSCKLHRLASTLNSGLVHSHINRTEDPLKVASFNSPLTAFRRYYSSEAKPEEAEQKASEQSSEAEEDAYSSVDDIRVAVLNAALNHVREMGFTKEAIAAGAADLSFSPMAHGLADKSGPDLFIHLLFQMNSKTEAHLKNLKETSDPALSPEAMLAAGLKHRLGQVAEWKDVWSQGLGSLHTAPSVAPDAMKIVTELGDSIVHYSGDTSTGPKWYTSRAAVIAVFKTAELVLLQDESEGCKDTMEFVDRRLDELHKGIISVESVENILKDSGKLLMAAFKTGMNIAGMNKFVQK